MDDRRFDDISKYLGTGLSRKGILRLLGGIGAAGVSAASVLLPAEAKKQRARKKHGNDRDKRNDRDNHKRGNDKQNDEAAQPAQAEAKKAKGKGKGKGKKRGKNKKSQQGGNQSQPQNQVNIQADTSPCGAGKVLICHKAGGSGNYTTNCVDDSAVCDESGHSGHDGDCVCLNSSVTCPGGTLPACVGDENVACGKLDGAVSCSACVNGTTACGPNCCTSSQTCCDGICVTTSTLCGGVCGNTCDANETCCGNECVASDTLCGGQCGNVCGPNQTCCAGTCVATNSLCGRICGNVCEANETCCVDVCVATSGLCGGICGNVCESNETCCDNTCVPTASFCGATCNVCDAGEKCCSGTCISESSCCIDDDCPPELCQTADCSNGRCDYTPVVDGQPGPGCSGGGKFCCNGDECCDPGDVCTGNGCCTPLTCEDYPGECGALDNGCGGTINCSCGNGTCCNGTCVSGDECCATDNCDTLTCQTVVCDDGTCDYTPVGNGQEGPNCTGGGKYCCNGEDCCLAGQICTGNGCCTPLTCAAYPDQCGTFTNNCGGTISCGCPAGEGCCSGTCVDDTECCVSGDCDAELCQTVACDNGTCDYTPVADNEQGPLCTGQGQFCCGGDTCCTTPEVCTREGTCCTPKTCAAFPGECGVFDDGCGGRIECGCGNDTCCNGICVSGDECCATEECDAVLCQTVVCAEGTCDYTPVSDNQPGPLCNDDGEFCCGGDTCCTTPEICTGEGTCCLPKTCEVDYPGQCGTFPQGCGLPDLNCTCEEGGCCEGVCQGDDQCCVSGDCEELVCRTVDCTQGECNYTPVENNEPGPLCENEGEFCCNGNDCCEAEQICTGEGCCTPLTCDVDYAGQCGTFSQGCGLPDLTCECAADELCNPQGICIVIPACTPLSIEVACAGLQCGPASNGCGVDYDCGLCATKKKKGQRPIKQTCVAGVCKPFKKKRCIGSGLAGQPCGGKCKCANGRKCNNGRCCEGTGDGSVHCTANSDCCPGLMCAYRRPGQHRVCMPRNAKGLFTESTEATATPGIAVGAILTGLAATLGAKLTGNGEPASVAMDEMQIHTLGPRD